MTENEPNDDLPPLARRNRDADIDAKQSFLKIAGERLFELQMKTDPKNGRLSEKEKDEAAYDALNLIGKIAQTLAGWAIDHQIGLALSGKGFVGRGTTKMRNKPDHVELQRQVDTHEHEIKGANFYSYPYAGANGPPVMNGEQLRQLLTNMLYPNAWGIDSAPREQLLKALQAAISGEVHEVFTIENSGHTKNNYQKEELQINALRYVAFRRALGNSQTDAEWMVGEAYGVEGTRVSKWLYELRKKRGAEPIGQAISFAENGASYVAAGSNVDKYSPAMIHQTTYGDEALNRDGEIYKALNLSGNKKNK